MAIHIQIKKLSDKGNLYYYEVSTKDFDIAKPFYIGIDTLKMRMYIYEDILFQEKKCTVNLQQPSLCKCNFIVPRLMALTIASVVRAIEKKQLNDYISHQA